MEGEIQPEIMVVMKNEDVFTLLEEIRNNILQITELESEEKRLILNLCSIIKKILNCLDFLSYTLPATILKEHSNVIDALLSRKGELILKRSDGLVEIMNLEDCPSEWVISIFTYLVPQLKELAISYKQKILNRVSFLEKINRSVQSMEQVIDGVKEEQNNGDKSQPVDAVKKIFESE